MLIGDKWQIKADSLNVTLYKKFISKTNKKPCWVAFGHYPNLKNALHQLMEQGIRGTGIKDLEAVCGKIDGLHKLIDGLPVDITV